MDKEWDFKKEKLGASNNLYRKLTAEDPRGGVSTAHDATPSHKINTPFPSHLKENIKLYNVPQIPYHCYKLPKMIYSLHTCIINTLNVSRLVN